MQNKTLLPTLCGWSRSNPSNQMSADTPTPTPRTDAAILCHPRDGGMQMDLVPFGLVVKADFARQLERELTQARSELAACRKDKEGVEVKLADAEEMIADHDRIDDTEWRRQYAEACVKIAEMDAQLAQATRDGVRLREALEEIVSWKRELFEDGLEADLYDSDIKTLGGAYNAGFMDANTELVDMARAALTPPPSAGTKEES